MCAEKLTTWYASADRAGMDVIQRQYGYFRDDPLLIKTLGSISTAVLILNTQRQLVYANQAFLRLAKFDTLSPLLGQRVGEALDCIHWNKMEGGCGTSEYCQECGAVKAILSSLDGKQDVQDCRISLNERNTALDLRVFTSQLRHEDEDFVVFSVLDVASEKRSQVLERLFLHDIKNTIGSIQGYSHLLMDKEDIELDKTKEMLLKLSDSLMEELESFSQLKHAENMELEVRQEAFSSLALLEKTKTRYDKHTVAAGKRIRVDKEAVDIQVKSDPVLLGRVLGNMVKNALEFIETGNVVTLSCQNNKNRIRFSVHNPGSIPLNVQRQIFQRSFSTKGTGRGLGTYSIRLISEEYLQGEVGFSSSEAEGTVFYGEYPLAMP